MPRTRNISRAQWQAASVSTASASATTSMTTRRSSRSTQQRGENNENSQPQVSTRTTRATSSRTAVLTSSSISATRSTRKATTASAVGGSAKKGKGTVTLRKKQPLQDITAEILGQLESTHPGVAAPANAQTPASPPMDDTPASAPTQTRIQVQIPFASSLPPSSPPLFTSSPAILRSQPAAFDCLPCLPLPPVPHNTVRKKGTTNNSSIFTGIGEDDPELDAWDEFDARVEEGAARAMMKSDTPTPTSLDSDPFGFFALEKKLKVERDAQAAAEADVMVKKTKDQPVEAMESGGRVLVPGTSSSGSPVIAPFAPFPIPTPMPAPPHKKKDHARLSLVAFCDEQSEEGKELSSPSPTKPRVTKKKRSSPSKDKEDGGDENDDGERRVKRVRSNPSLPVPKLAESGSKRMRTSLGSRNA